MTFDIVESSRAGRKPVRLFEFNYGPSGFFRFTDAEDTIEYPAASGNFFTAMDGPISFGVVRVSGDLDRSDVECKMPDGTGLEDLFLIYPPAIPVTLIVRYGHIGDPEFKLAFTGVVLTVSREGPEAVYTCEPITSALKRPGLRRQFLVPCPRILYQGGCPANKADATASVQVQAIPSSNVLTMSANWHDLTSKGIQPFTKFRGGTVEWVNAVGATEVRSILRPSATSIILGGPVRDLIALDNVDVVLGCDRSMDDCEFLHNVIRSHGGWPFVPLDNPFEIANNFY